MRRTNGPKCGAANNCRESQLTAENGNEEKPLPQDISTSTPVPIDAIRSTDVRSEIVGDTGLERCGKTRGKPNVATSGNADSDAAAPKEAAVAPDLASLIDAWHGLPGSAKKAILHLIQPHEPPSGQ